MKYTISLFILAGCIFLLSGCGQKTNKIQEDNIQNIMQDCRTTCDMLTKTAEEKKDCLKMCETSEKLESNTIKDCDDIEEVSGGFITKDICIQDKAIKMKNPDFCEMIETQVNKDACYMSLAEELNNKQLCEKISSEIIRNICIEEIK